MLTLFSRPSRRPRTVRRASARPALRVEVLETRANPSAPAFAAVKTTWTDAYDVTVTGTIVATNPATTFVGVTSGGAIAMAYANAAGGFQVSLHFDGTSAVSIQAHDSQGLSSGVVTDSSGMAIAQTYSTTSLGLTNVQIVYENGGWHIRGNVVGGTPGQTVINIVSSLPGNTGPSTVIENPDGSFDIGINMAPGSPGGTISITAQDTLTGFESEVWEGIVG